MRVKLYGTMVLFVLSFFFVLSNYVEAAHEDALKAAARSLCRALEVGDRDAFESMLASERKSLATSWWETARYGRDAAAAYGGCEYDSIDIRSTAALKKVYIQRYGKDGLTKSGRPVPVFFSREDSGDWKISGYGL